MAPKRQKKVVEMVVKTTQVVEETVQVAVVDEEGNNETVAFESPPTRVFEVSIEEGQSGIESITVVKSTGREEKRDKGEGREEPVSMDMERRKVGESSIVEVEQIKERGKEQGREEPAAMNIIQSEEGMEEREETMHVGDKEREIPEILKQGRQGEQLDGDDGRETSNREGQSEGSVEEVTDMRCQNPEEIEGERQAKVLREEEEREMPEEPERGDMETEEAGLKKEGVQEKKNPRKRKKRNAIPSRGHVGMGGVGGYKTYVYRVLKQVHPTLGMSSRAMDVLDMMMADMFERLADEASRLSKYTGKLTITSRVVHDAVRLVLPGNLCKHAISEGTKALSKYMEEKY